MDRESIELTVREIVRIVMGEHGAAGIELTRSLLLLMEEQNKILRRLREEIAGLKREARHG